MEKEVCKDCFWRSGKLCSAADGYKPTRFVRYKDCFDRFLKEKKRNVNTPTICKRGH